MKKKSVDARHRQAPPLWGFRCSQEDCGQIWAQCTHFEPQDVQRAATRDNRVGFTTTVTAVVVALCAAAIGLYYLL